MSGWKKCEESSNYIFVSEVNILYRAYLSYTVLINHLNKNTDSGQARQQYKSFNEKLKMKNRDARFSLCTNSFMASGHEKGPGALKAFEPTL